MLRDLNVNNGDIIISNTSIETDFSYDEELTIKNRLRNLIQKTVIYNDELINEIKNKKNIDTFKLESELTELIISRIKEKYPFDTELYLFNVEVLILVNKVYLYFYYFYDGVPKLLKNIEFKK